MNESNLKISILFLGYEMDGEQKVVAESATETERQYYSRVYRPDVTVETEWQGTVRFFIAKDLSPETAQKKLDYWKTKFEKQHKFKSFRN